MKHIKDLMIPDNDAVNYRSGNDAPFRRLFFDDGLVRDIINKRIYFLIGEKGTGKTAYATFLSGGDQSAFQGRVIFVQPDDYGLISSVMNKLGIDETQITSVMQVSLLLLLLLHISEAKEAATFGHYGSQVLEALDKLTYGSLDITISSSVLIIDRCVDVASDLLKIDHKVETPPTPQLALMALRKILLNSIKDVTTKTPFSIFIDGIDVRPQNVEFSTFINVVTGIINSTWSINNEYLQRIDGDFRCILSIRPDILDHIGIQNSNNKIKDNSVVFSWYTAYQDYRSSRLFALTDNLLRVQQDSGADFSLGYTWDSYFPYKNFHKGEKTRHSFIGFLESSFYKPRDIISLLGMCKARMLAKQLADTTEFDEHLLSDNELREEYSRYLLGEVRDSLLFYYQVKEIELFRQFFEFLVDHVDRRSRTFEYRSFITAYDNTISYIRRNDLSVPVIFETADKFLQVLYEQNVIGFLEEGYTPGRMINRWSFRERSFANIRPKVSTGVLYRIHFGIARALYPARIR